MRFGICLGCVAMLHSAVVMAAASSLAPLAPDTAGGVRPAARQNFQSRQSAQRIVDPVLVTRGASGRKVIFNENLVQHARRFAGQLLPVPDLPGLPSGALEPLILRHCGAHDLDPRLVRAVIQVESGYNRRARSNRGAIGLMQLMPDTALELAVRDPYDVDENLRGGTTYLRQLIDAFPRSLELAVAAYNAGPGAVQRHRGVPPYPETVAYVDQVMALYHGGLATPATSAVLRYQSGRRPAPYVARGANGRLMVTTSLGTRY